jgi:hypothetical protein
VSFKVSAALPQHSVDGCEGEHGTAQHSTAQHSTVPRNTSQHATLWCAETRCRDRSGTSQAPSGLMISKTTRGRRSRLPALCSLSSTRRHAPPFCVGNVRWEPAARQPASDNAAPRVPCECVSCARLSQDDLGPAVARLVATIECAYQVRASPGLALALALRTCSRATCLRSASEQHTPCQVNRWIFFEVFIHKVPCRCALQALDARAALPGPTGART